MNLFDILILLMILVSFGAGLRSGLVKQVFSLAAIVGGVALGFFFYQSLGAVLLEKNIVTEPRIADILGFLAVACLAYMLIHYVSRFLTDLLETVKLGWINHILGGAVGFIVGLLLCYSLVTGVKRFVDEDAPFLKDSVLAPKVITGYQIIRERTQDDLDESLEKLRELREEKQELDFE